MKTFSAYTVFLLFFAAAFLYACSLDKTKDEIKPMTAHTSAVVSNAQSSLPAKQLILRSGEGLTTSKVIQTDCQIIFLHKCYSGNDFDLTNFFTLEQIQTFCNQSPNVTCSSQECIDRLSVLINLVRPEKQNGQGSCLPPKHIK